MMGTSSSTTVRHDHRHDAPIVPTPPVESSAHRSADSQPGTGAVATTTSATAGTGK